MTLLPRLSILLSLATCTHALRFLALHGGTDNPTTFQGQMGDVVNALGSSHTWVYAQGAYPNPVAGTAGEYLWIRDAPGGKNAGTTDPNWAQASFTSLDNYVATQGPFDAIVGYSQGAAMTLLYLSQSASSFRFALTFCGYLPTVHSGLMGLVDAAAPMSIPIAFYYGTSDSIITNDMTLAAAAKFSDTTMICDGGGHAPPTDGEAVTAVVDFINNPAAATSMASCAAGGGAGGKLGDATLWIILAVVAGLAIVGGIAIYCFCCKNGGGGSAGGGVEMHGVK